jgi:hypothetical protein
MKQQLAEITGNYQTDITLQIQLLDLERRRLLIQNAGNDALLSTINLLYQEKEARIAAMRDMNLGSLMEYGMQDYSVRVWKDTANTFQNAIPNSIQATENAFRSLFDNMTSGTMKTGDAFNQFFTDLNKGFAKLVQDILFATAQMAIFGKSSMLGGSGGILGSIFEALGIGSGSVGIGNIVADTAGPFHLASGGIATRPTLGVFGEAGPEALIPLSSPRATSLLRSDNASQEEITQNIYLVDDRNKVPPLGPRDVIAIVSQDFRRNGVIRQTFRKHGG